MLPQPAFRWLVPWKWAPLVVALGFQTAAGPFRLDATFLIIPIAVHLALRYGGAGWAVIAVSALPLVVDATIADTVRTAPAVSVYLSAMVLAGWLCRREPAAGSTLPRLRASPGILLLLFLLPFRVGLWGSEGGWLGAFEVGDLRWVIDGYTLFFLLVFALGASRAPPRPVLIALTLFALMGIGLAYLPLPSSAAELFGAQRAVIPGLGLTELRPIFVQYRFDAPAQWLTALAYFAFGRHLATRSDGAGALADIPTRLALLASLSLLALGGYVNEFMLHGLGAAFDWLGSYHALLLAGVVAGLYFRFAGILALCVLVALFALVDALVRADIYGLSGMPITVDVGDFLVVYGFGTLGVRIRDRLSQTASTLWSGPWVRFMAVYLLFLIAIIPVVGPWSLLLVAAALFGGIGVTMALGAFRDRLTGSELRLGGAWISLVSALMLVYLAYDFATGAWDSLLHATRQAAALATQLVVAAKVLDEESILMLSFIVPTSLLLLWTFGITIERLVKTSRQLSRDVRAVLQHWKHRLPVVIRVAPGAGAQAAAPPPPRRFPALQALRWTNRALLAAAIATPMCLIAYNTWLDYRERSADRLAERNAARLENRLERSRDETALDRRRARTAFENVLIRAAEKTLGDFPGLVVHRGRFDASVTTMWRVDPADDSVRRRVVVTIRPAIGYDDMPLEQAVAQSLWVRVYRQDRVLFGLWGEDVRGRPFDDSAYAADLERAIEQTAIAASRTDGDDASER